MKSALDFVNSLSLAKQFFLAGGVVTAIATIIIGLHVTEQIAQTVTRNAAATTALYVDSIIAPVLPDLTRETKLDESIERTLDETLGQGALGKRLVSFRLWRKDGLILYSNDKKLMGRVVPPGENRKRAFDGELVAKFDEVDDPESGAERAVGEPLLEIYNPILQPWSGQVVAVTEFYERAGELERSLKRARFRSWVVVITVTAGFFLILSAIVLRGSRTIERQLQENLDLTLRVKSGSQRAVAFNERFLRRVGADLHDGPAQLMAYAALRMDSEQILSDDSNRATREEEVATIKESLDEAIRDIRIICRGLILPHIETLSVSEAARRAVEHYQSRTDASVDSAIEPLNYEVPVALKICVYRFIQEGLNNGWRHADGKGQRVELKHLGNEITVIVQDAGQGFKAENASFLGLGLSGLRERVESLGGKFQINSSFTGTTLTMVLNINDPMVS
ncbi:sensor histidine kinase [Rhizobium rhizogenes]|uniref:sensor histidine kinase n=1 Tax=Rhizobium rhizogenes TaxID=359 RepID=UPI001573AC8C|nr:sensor histidine kinase [Rhizobium rhizogenes]NTF98243.1 sensor histidine kinase [Rhizobium rhizogenes]